MDNIETLKHLKLIADNIKISSAEIGQMDFDERLINIGQISGFYTPTEISSLLNKIVYSLY